MAGDARPPIPWRYLTGPGLVLVSIGGLHLLAAVGLPLPNPGAALVLAVIAAALWQGTAVGFVSAAIAWAYTAYTLSTPGQPLAFDTESVQRLAVWAAVLPAAVVLAGLYRRSNERWHQRLATVPTAKILLSENLNERDALIQGFSMLNAVVEGTTDAVFIKDPNGRYLMLNSAGARFFDRTPEELIGKDDRAIFSDAATVDAIRAVDAGVFKDGRTTTVEETLVIDGKARVFLATKGVYRDDAGKVAGMFGISREITELRAAERALGDREARLRAILDNAPQAITVVDENGVLVEINAAGVAMMEAHSAEQALGQRVEAIVAPDHLAAFRAQAQRVAAGESAQLVFEIIGLRGTRRWLSNHSVPLRDDKGRVVAGLGISEDVTEQRHAELALRETDSHFRSMLDGARNFMLYRARVVPDSPYKAEVVLVSPSITEVMGVRDPYDISTWFENIHAEDLPRIAQAQQRSTDQNEPFDQVMRIFHPARNEWRWIHAISRPIYNPLDRQTYFDGFVIDVSERMRNEEATRRMNEELEERVRERTAELETALRELEAFSYSVSHDLRAPLRAIQGFGELLAEDFRDQLGSEGMHYIARIRNGVDEMGRIIDGLLRLSRVTRTELKKEPIDLSALAAAIAQDLRAQDPERAVEMLIANGLLATGDRALLHIALQNLLQNAWKFTGKRAHAQIEFDARRVDGRTIYFIRDNGAGFDMAYAGKLFGVFQRLHRATEFAGLGIGLATVERIMARHGGRIWAEGAVDQGATFFFELPSAEQPGGEAG